MQVSKPMMPIILDLTGRPLEPHCVSSFLICWLMAGCDQPVALAVAENEPYCSICHNVTNDWGLSVAIGTSFVPFCAVIQLWATNMTG